MRPEKFIKKPAGGLLTLILAVILVAAAIPFTVNAEIDDSFADGNLIYYVTAEGVGSAPGEVLTAFNESIEPETVTAIKVPGTVTNEGKIYSVTEIVCNAFANCSALETLDLSECSELTEIGMSAFVECESLDTIIIPCDFDKTLFANTGVAPDGDLFTIEYVTVGDFLLLGSGETTQGTFVYTHNWVSNGNDGHKCSRCDATGTHDWKLNDKNNAEHICKECSAKEKHVWTVDKENPSQHKCTVCGTSENHYGGTPDCEGKADCVACGAMYQAEQTGGSHTWQVIPETIGATSAEYQCKICPRKETEEIGAAQSTSNYNGQNLKVILQDPYKVLPEGVKVKASSVEPGTARYNELLAHLDDSRHIENIAFFDIDLINNKDEFIRGEIAGKVRILIQIPDGWDKEDLKVTLIMPDVDIEFEESVITIDGVDYLAFWTYHFSPYVLIDMMSENDVNISPDTGDAALVMIISFAIISVSSAIIAVLVVKRKRKI